MKGSGDHSGASKALLTIPKWKSSCGPEQQSNIHRAEAGRATCTVAAFDDLPKGSREKRLFPLTWTEQGSNSQGREFSVKSTVKSPESLTF